MNGHSPSLREHALETLSCCGAAYGQVEDGLFEALLPESLSARLGLPESWLFTFDPEIASERRDADLLAFGSPLLDTLLEVGLASGAVSRACVNGLFVDDPKAAAAAARALSVEGADIVPGEAWVRNVRFARFLFQVSFLTDVREEDLRCAVVDTSTGEIARRLEAELADARLEPIPNRPFLNAPAIPMAESYARARAEVLRRASAARSALKREVERRESEERRRLMAFHEGYREEAEAQKLRYRSSPERAAAIESKLRSSRLELEGRLAELPGKYAVRTELRLRAVLEVSHPMVYAQCWVERKGARVGALVPRWNPREGQALPAACPGCNGLSYEFIVRTGPREARPVRCPRCVA